MDKQVLQAQIRKVSGRKVKGLRKTGLLPANIYGKKIKSQAIEIALNEFNKVFAAAGETGLITLKIGGKKANGEDRVALVANVQYDPVSDLPLHVDFRQVDLKEKVVAQVPVEVLGESPAEKGGVGTVVQYINEIEVEALPADLPEKFEIDVSALAEVDQAVLVKDLNYDKSKVGVKVDPEEIIVKVEPPQKEEVVAPAKEEVPEGAEAAAEAPVEGEAPTEAQEEGQRKEAQKGEGETPQ
ncbi:MAG: 50S ribosomal protein L25 [Patescibacteria group bacterium]